MASTISSETGSQTLNCIRKGFFFFTCHSVREFQTQPGDIWDRTRGHDLRDITGWPYTLHHAQEGKTFQAHCLQSAQSRRYGVHFHTFRPKQGGPRSSTMRARSVSIQDHIYLSGKTNYKELPLSESVDYKLVTYSVSNDGASGNVTESRRSNRQRQRRGDTIASYHVELMFVLDHTIWEMWVDSRAYGLGVLDQRKYSKNPEVK